MSVLAVDDASIQRFLLKNCLEKRGFRPIIVEDGEKALAVLNSPDAPRLVVLDWELPGISGLEICRHIRSTQAERYTYIVLLTGRSELADIVAGLESGADDFICKPFKPAELAARLSTGCRILELQEQLIAARDANHRLAMYDSLTGLLNRRAILERLEKELARAGRQKTVLGVMILDLDHFKAINDSFGHLFGDEVLRRIGAILPTVLRPYDAAGRFGGEEFLILMPDCGYADLQRRADEVRLSIAGCKIKYEGQECQQTVSIGLTTFDPEFPPCSMTLLHLADAALYEAKRAGRNRIASSEHLTSLDINALQDGLQQAILNVLS
jgi:diguanylate cyclase (GGDEF)-like protein